MHNKKQAATVGGKSDLVTTPDRLAHRIVDHFLPQITGRVLEPCFGKGPFLRAFSAHGITDVASLEIAEGSDFLEFHEPVSWVITNPPWSKARGFALHAYGLAGNIVWLINTGHFLGFRARLLDMKKAKFGIKEVLLCKTPPADTGWPQSGFQLGALHFQNGWDGPTQFSWQLMAEGTP